MRKLPEPQALGQLLTGLLGRNVKVKAVTKHPLPATQSVVAARYAAEDGQLVVACVADLRLAAMAGAALTMVPVGIAKAGVEAGQLSDSLKDNFAEVLNIVAQLVTNAGHSRVLLQKMELTRPPLLPDLATLLAGPRVDFDVTIEGYGAGSLTFAG